MTHAERAALFREIAQQASPVTAGIFGEIAATHDQKVTAPEGLTRLGVEEDRPRMVTDYLRPESREPGEEG